MIAHNPSYEDLYKAEINPALTGYEKGQETELGAVNVMTGIFTGRSPKDKYIVDDAQSHNNVWWTTEGYKNDNHPMSEEVWAKVKDIAVKELSNKQLYVVDAFCGANEATRLAVRFVLEVAWQAHFIKNMFIQPTAEELANFEPNFVIYNASKAKVENFKELGLNSETCVAFNTTSREQVIINTWYGGEMKKGMFSMQNYYLPLKGIASMHCSANTDMEGKNTAIFFGLSGTGKTTLSTDPKRLLIGDDEHGWDDEGVFNLEGGCYAKVINLSKENEPDIYGAIKRNALLENVTVDANGKIDFADKSVTENTRVSYPINHINNIVQKVAGKSAGPAAQNVIFLSADAFGSRLMHSAYCPPYLSSPPSRLSTTSSLASPPSSLVQSAESPNPPRPSRLASARHSSSSIRQSTQRNSLRRCRSLVLRLTSLTLVGTALASVSPFPIPVASSTPSSTALSSRLPPSRFLTSTSPFRPSSTALLGASSIPAIPTRIAASGMRRLRISLAASSRTSLSTPPTKPARLSLPLVPSSKMIAA